MVKSGNIWGKTKITIGELLGYIACYNAKTVWNYWLHNRTIITTSMMLFWLISNINISGRNVGPMTKYGHCNGWENQGKVSLSCSCGVMMEMER